VAAILVTGLWPVPEPKVQITALTSDERSKSNYLVIAGGRVIYQAGGLTPGERRGLWSVPTTGGEPRREPSPCPEGAHTGLGPASYLRRRMLLVCGSEGSSKQIWLTDFDGGNPKWIGDFNLDNTQVSISPDLKTLLFDRKEGLFVKPVDGGPEKLLAKPSEGDIIEYNYWHPSGRKFGFFLKVKDAWRMYEMNADGTGMRPLLPDFPGPQYGGYWSSDGRRLYFLSNREGLPNNDVYLLAGRGWLGWMRPPAPVRLTSGPVSFGLPNEDPDNPLAVYLPGGSSQAAAMKLNLKTNAWEPFLGGISADCFAYSPDGESIAYVSAEGAQLWKCRKDGSGKVLLDDGLETYNPHWSPDGSRIAFSGRPYTTTHEVEAPTPFRVYTISANGGKREPMPGAEGPGFDPSWSPDGKRIAFAPNLLADKANKEQRHVSIVNLDTGAVEAVPGSDNIWSTVWSPDGKWLAGIAQNGPAQKPVVYSFAMRQWTPLAEKVMGHFRWSKDSRYLYGLTFGPAMEIVRIEIATRKLETVRAITEFNLAGVLGPSASWTPEDEPIVLKNVSSSQIYRIERDR
jgi:Tol biopolymer transport system component